MQNTNATIKAIESIILRGLGERPVALVLTFGNGRDLTVEVDQLNEAIRAEATVHGLKQKLHDAAAISRNPLTGKSASFDDKYEAALAVYNRITSPDGTWNAIREGTGVTGGLLARALVVYYAGKLTIDEVRAKLADYTDEQKAALRDNKKIAAIIAELKAEKVDPSIDTDALLQAIGE